MSTFSALTPAQQSLVSSWVTSQFRPIARAMKEALATLAAVDLGVWQPTLVSIITGLDAGTAIPDNTGLAGAQPLVREDILNFMAMAESALASTNTPANIALYNKIGGV